MIAGLAPWLGMLALALAAAFRDYRRDTFGEHRRHMTALSAASGRARCHRAPGSRDGEDRPAPVLPTFYNQEEQT